MSKNRPDAESVRQAELRKQNEALAKRSVKQCKRWLNVLLPLIDGNDQWTEHIGNVALRVAAATAGFDDIFIGLNVEPFSEREQLSHVATIIRKWARPMTNVPENDEKTAGRHIPPGAHNALLQALNTLEGGPPTHSDDFTSANWYGTRYTFTKSQARCIELLWEQWEKDPGFSLGEEAIGEKIGSNDDRFRMENLFRVKKPGPGKKKPEAESHYEPHPAWGTMIQPTGKGIFRLAMPESELSG